jgi:hypothetical protein
MNARTLVTLVCGIAALGSTASAQDLSRYRNFEAGSSLATVAATASVAASEAKTLYQRPAVIQDLEWRPSRWSGGSSTPSNDPVEQVVFSFYDDRLFRVVVDYGREQTEGMTPADLIAAISEVYGTPAARPASPRVASRVEVMSGTRLARWEDGAHMVVLYRTDTYREAFRLIVTSVALDGQARKAEADSVRLDAREAPQREIARQKKEKDDGLAAAEKARLANKKVFRP